MPKKKHRVNLLVNTEILEQWDRLASSIGCDRTALIHNAIKVYELFITNQLNGDRKRDIEEQLEQILILIEGLHQREKLLDKGEKAIDDEISAVNTENIKDFNIVADKILELLKNWGPLPESTISAHLQYPGWIIWTVLKKLKTMKKVKVERGEWLLYAK